MNKAHVIDIETGSTREDALIYSVAIVTVDLDLPMANMILFVQEAVLDQDTQPGRVLDVKTQKWWAEQSHEAKLAISCHTPKTLVDFLAVLSFMLQKQPYPIWGNGSDFDNRILQHAFNQYELHWPYRLNRCLRTLKNEVCRLKPDLKLPAFEGIRHIAINDARHEARELKVLTDVLKGRIQ